MHRKSEKREKRGPLPSQGGEGGVGRGSDFRPETPPNPYNIDLIHFMFIKRHNKRKNPKNDDFYANFPKKMGEKREFRVKIGSENVSTGYHMKENVKRNRFQASNLIF